MLNVPSACILGMVALIAVGGCGSGSGRPIGPPPDASSARGPSLIDPGAKPPAPVIEAEEGPRSVPGLRRSFDAPLRAPAVATGDPELDPLVAYLKASFSAPIKDGSRLVINGMTTDAKMPDDREPYQHMVDGFQRDASEQVPAERIRDFTEMIRDFGEKNRESHAVWPELTRHLPASLLAPGEHEAIFSGPRDDGWKRFHAKYPDAYGIITVSRVGLNREKTLAFFYVSVGHGSLNGHGQMHVLKKQGDAWVELPIHIGPNWTA